MSTATTAMPGAGPVTQQLTEGLHRISQQPLPPAVEAAARGALLEAVTSAVEGSRTAAIDALVTVLGAQHGAGTLPVLGRSERLGVLPAATINGASARGSQIDAGSGAGRTVAPESTAMATALTLGALEGASGAAVLRAFAVTCEAQTRLDSAMQPEHAEQGWNATSTTAAIGATFGAGLLLGLDVERLTHAVGIGMSQTTGSRQADGSPIEPFMAGKGAANGIHSALMARAGITSTRIALEHVRGFFALLSLGTARLDAVTDGLGERWVWMESDVPSGTGHEGRVDAVLPGAGAALVAAVEALPSAGDCDAVMTAATSGGQA